jgi:N-acetylglutamate synthase-like GNAT family acetyltransferase
VELREAHEQDVPAIVALIASGAEVGLLLPRDENSVRVHLEDFTVSEEDGVVIGCAALTPLKPDVAEIRSLIVREEQRGRGIGRALVRALLRHASEVGYDEVVAVTKGAVGFYAGLGFAETSFDRFPPDVLRECDACPRYSSGRRTGMVRSPAGQASAETRELEWRR